MSYTDWTVCGYCSKTLFWSNGLSVAGRSLVKAMLIDGAGQRKYLVPEEWRAFLIAATHARAEVRTFCFVLAYTGARVSEVLALTPKSIDFANNAIIIECLKRRKRGIFRAVPVTIGLIALLERTHQVSLAKADPSAESKPLWPWCRTTAWTRVKELGEEADIPKWLRTPRALRHSFGVEGTTYANVPLVMLKRWMGHSRLESTIVYCEAVGDQERELSARMFAASATEGALAASN